MTMSRREFFLATSGAVSGLILPSFYEKVIDFTESFGEPLLEVPRNPKIVLNAVDWVGDGDYELNWGNPQKEPNLKMTLREYAKLYCGGEQGYLDMYGEEREWVDFDEVAFEPMVHSTWQRQDSPMARAHHLLDKFDLGLQFTGEDPVGELAVVDGPMPGSDYLATYAVGSISLSLLQQRLNDLDAGISIELYSQI
jgi:hypothetical protein